MSQTKLFKRNTEILEESFDFKHYCKQRKAIFLLMADGKWRTLLEIEFFTNYRSDAAISARLRDYRKEKYGSHTVNTRRMNNRVWEYQLIVKK